MSRGGDIIETVGLDGLLRGTSDGKLQLKITNPSSQESVMVPVEHTMSGDQIDWLKAGSALNHIRNKVLNLES